jgi:hypothetical protein
MMLEAMSCDELAPMENVVELREGLAAHYGRTAYLRCNSMGALVRENMESIRLAVDAPQKAATRPEEYE